MSDAGAREVIRLLGVFYLMTAATCLGECVSKDSKRAALCLSCPVHHVSFSFILLG